MPNEAIMNAARAHYGYYADTAWWDNGMSESIKSEMVGRMRAAISAYFADVPVSEALVETVCAARHFGPGKWSDGVTDGVARIERIIAEKAVKAVCRQHAKELSNGC